MTSHGKVRQAAPDNVGLSLYVFACQTMITFLSVSIAKESSIYANNGDHENLRSIIENGIYRAK